MWVRILIHRFIAQMVGCRAIEVRISHVAWMKHVFVFFCDTLCLRMPCSRLLSSSALTQVLKKYLAFYGTPRFIATLTRACRWFLCCSCESDSQTISFILLFHLRQYLFASGLPTKIVYEFLICDAYPDYLSHYDLITLIIFIECFETYIKWNIKLDCVN
jgi:hypothetical protein